MPRLLLHGGTIVSADSETHADIAIENGVIKEIGTYIEDYDEEVDVTGKLLLPGLIDCHVHFREPGLEHKGTMQTESAAALQGGVTTVCEMPNTIPPTCTIAALADKVRRADSLKELRSLPGRQAGKNQELRSTIDIRFFFGVTQDIHLAALLELLNGTSEELTRLRARCCGVKLYLDHSTGEQKVRDDVLEDVFRVCGQHRFPVVVHAEDELTNRAAAAQNTRTNVAVHSLLRPAESEAIAIERAITLAQKHNATLHIAHLSTEQGLQLVRQAKKDGARVTCEVAPHHLIFTTDDYEHLGTFIKVNPPIRSAKHRFALWQGILDGTVDCIATDHAPHTLPEKMGVGALREAPLQAPSGIPGVATMLPLLLSIAAGHWPNPAEPNATCPPFSVRDIVRLCFTNPNRIFHLEKNDIIQSGHSWPQNSWPQDKTDIIVVDPTKEWTIHANNIPSLCGWTPYEGWKMKGAVQKIL